MYRIPKIKAWGHSPHSCINHCRSCSVEYLFVEAGNLFVSNSSRSMISAQCSKGNNRERRLKTAIHLYNSFNERSQVSMIERLPRVWALS
jgi:hypothetical protein